MKTRQLWKEFLRLVSVVRQHHATMKKPEEVHDFLHALIVAQYCDIIAENQDIGKLAFVAGICHNTDRLFPEVFVDVMVRYYLDNLTDLREPEKRLIVEAVINHSKPNDPNDNPVTVVLKDADRLAIIGPNSYMRAGQALYNYPAYNPGYIAESDPLATWKKPKNVLNAVKFWLEWESWLRAPKAKELAKPWFDKLREFIKGIEDQLKEVDLLPYPFLEDF